MGVICAWANLWYVDTDGDDWGAEGTTGIEVSCPPPGGYAPNQGDCDDFNPLINQGAPELCDFVDNDCNPTTDDGTGEPWYGDPCDGGDIDLCDEGIFLCMVGTQACSDESDDNMELCNTIDDDCNPVTTDGVDEPWNGDPCDGPDGDLCDEGISSCVAGAHVCNDETGDIPDICDGVDNDCDPASADGSEDPLNGTGCDTGLAGICSSGTTHCLAGSLTCEQEIFPTSEVCDGLDNDCDGIDDDGNPGGGGGCVTGLLGVCAEGTITCVSGSLQCIQDVEASEEICNDLVDNDCNGEVDCDDASCEFDPWCEPG